MQIFIQGRRVKYFSLVKISERNSIRMYLRDSEICFRTIRNRFGQIRNTFCILFDENRSKINLVYSTFVQTKFLIRLNPRSEWFGLKWDDLDWFSKIFSPNEIQNVFRICSERISIRNFYQGCFIQDD